MNLLETLPTLHRSQRLALGCLRRHRHLTRREICAILEWEPATTSRLLRPLLDNGLLRSPALQANDGGRSQAILELNPALGCAVGIELNFTAIQAAVVDLGGKILARSPRQSIRDLSPARVLELIKKTVKLLLAGQASLPPVLGCGVSFCGVIHEPGIVSRSYPGIQGWDGVPLADELEKSLGKTVQVEDDNLAGLLGEMRYGHALGVNDVLLVTMLDGIGLGIVSNGLIHRGAHADAGEFGHTCVIPDGPVCYCGGSGCLESLASSWAICKQVRDQLAQGVQSRLLSKLPPEQIGLEVISKADHEGEIFTRNILTGAGRWLGNSLAGIANILDPQRIILTGILAEAEKYETLVNSMRQGFEHGLWHAKSRQIEMVPTAHGPDCYMIGAAALVFEKILPAHPEQLLTPARPGLSEKSAS